MRDDTSTGHDALDEGALLAAYLDGGTDEVTTARIERRLSDDDALAERLDSIAATRARLQRLDEVAAPADVRARLREVLHAERAAVDGAGAAGRAGRHAARDPGGPADGRRWSARAAPAMAAAAAVVLVAVLGAAAVLGQLGTGGSEESAGGGVSLEADAGAEAGAPQAAAPEDDAAGATGDGAAVDADGAGTDAGRGGGTDRQAAAEVDGDADIAARAERLRGDPPGDLRARERRLRDRAGLSTARLCVRELEAATVDLVDEDGRVALAILVEGPSPQIVLLDPRTCAAIRTISTQR